MVHTFFEETINKRISKGVFLIMILLCSTSNLSVFCSVCLVILSYPFKDLSYLFKILLNILRHLFLDFAAILHFEKFI